MMLSLLLAVLPARAEDPPTTGVMLSLNAYGESLMGHLMVDADQLAKLGLKLKVEDAERTGPVVPLAHGTRVLGLEQGERQVQDAVDSLMYFDANKDGYLDAADPAFAALSLFVDKDGDQVIDKGEVRTLGDIGVDSISRFGSIRMKERTQ